jgi:hypothetical protein
MDPKFCSLSAPYVSFLADDRLRLQYFWVVTPYKITINVLMEPAVSILFSDNEGNRFLENVGTYLPN